jgi:hypothetical protein
MRIAVIWLCLVSGIGAPLYGAPGRAVTNVVVERLMSAEEFRNAGLEKLTAPELSALNAWLQKFVIALATEDAPRTRASITGKWLALDSNTVRIVRDDGPFIYAEAFTRDEKESLGNYDLARQQDGAIRGRAKLRWSCKYWCRDISCDVPKWIENSCTTEDEVVFTSVTLTRIEGYVMAPQRPEPLDRAYAKFCRTCGANLPKVKQVHLDPLRRRLIGVRHAVRRTSSAPTGVRRRGGAERLDGPRNEG